MFEIFLGVSRHAGRIIYLRYKGAGSTEKTVYLVGKGVTYDTGGADIKAGGVMAGMHRDKCGSAAVAAFMKVNNLLLPPPSPLPLPPRPYDSLKCFNPHGSP